MIKPNQMQTTIKNRVSHAYLLKSDTVCIEYEPSTTPMVNDVIESYQSFLTLSEGRCLKKLTIIGKNTFFDASIQCQIQEDIKPKAEAFVSDSLAIRLTLQNCSRLTNAKHEWRLFKTKAEALAWLDTH